LDYKIISVDLGWGLLLLAVHNVVMLHLAKRPTTQRALGSTYTLALVFGVEDSMVVEQRNGEEM
jgi:hypothetical protein